MATIIPTIDDIISYEQGDMDEDEIIQFFQSLIDTGMAWQLQGTMDGRLWH